MSSSLLLWNTLGTISILLPTQNWKNKGKRRQSKITLPRQVYEQAAVDSTMTNMQNEHNLDEYQAINI
jgi:hypothetical protein